MIPGEQLLAHAESGRRCSEYPSRQVPKSQPMHASTIVQQQGQRGVGLGLKQLEDVLVANFTPSCHGAT